MNEPIDLSGDLTEIELKPGSEAWWLNEVEVLDARVRDDYDLDGNDVADLIHACFEHDQIQRRKENRTLAIVVVVFVATVVTGAWEALQAWLF